MNYVTVSTDSEGDSANKYRLPDISKNAEIGLLFGNDQKVPLTEDETRAILSDPLLHKLLSPDLHYMQHEGRLFVARLCDELILPSKADRNDPAIRYFFEGKFLEKHPHQRFDECVEIVRTMGCEFCPKKGPECYREGGVPVSDAPPAFDAKGEVLPDLYEVMQKQKPTIAGFKYLSPMMTKDEDNSMANFWPAIRGLDLHDFTQADHWHKERSAAAKTREQNRRFKKGECGVCPLESACDRFRSCDGAYPREDVLVKVGVEQFERLMAETPMPLWQQWALIRGGGIECPKFYQRKKVILSGMVVRNHRLYPRMFRSKTSTDDITPDRWEYENYACLFGLPLVEPTTPADLTRWGRPSDMDIALLNQVIYNNHYRVRAGWGSRYRDIVALEIRSHGGIDVIAAKPRELLSWQPHVGNFAKYYDYFQTPRGVEQRHVRSEYRR